MPVTKCQRLANETIISIMPMRTKMKELIYAGRLEEAKVLKEQIANYLEKYYVFCGIENIF